jgi:hypothetical protein
VNDVTQGHALLHGDEEVVFADAGYPGAMKRNEATGVPWQVAMRLGKGRASVSGDQAPVRICEGAIPRASQEHRTTAHAVCAEQLVDGQKAGYSGDAGIFCRVKGRLAAAYPLSFCNIEVMMAERGMFFEHFTLLR